MSVTLTELQHYLDECLEPSRFGDYCPNGLQVEGAQHIHKVATGVTASQALLDEAIAWGADAILVHHGYFWRGESPQVVGIKRRRLAALLCNEVSLLAYHLPLDAHPTLGNNAQLGVLMGIPLALHRPLFPGDTSAVGNIATLAVPSSAGQVVQQLEDITGRRALHVGDPQAKVRCIAWCTGAAQSYIDAAIGAGADMFITGEASEQTVHIAREESIHFVAAGHHATERYGVKALGEELAQHFGLEHSFIDIDNPV